MSDELTFALPDVGEGIAEAEVVQWLVAEGDTITTDQPLVLIETDKSQLELPSPATGVVAGIGPAEGDVVPVGGRLVDITPSASSPAPARPVPGDETPREHGLPSSHTSGGPTERTHARPLASPSTRRLAASNGVELTGVRGSGPHGRILRSDVEAILDAGDPPTERPVTPPADTDTRSRTWKLTGLRRQIALSMTESLRIPQITEFRLVDATALLTARTLLAERIDTPGARFTMTPLLAAATIWSLRRNPRFNARFDDRTDTVSEISAVHLGIATETTDGLIVPVVHEADRQSLAGLSERIADATDRARKRTATPEALNGGTFTVTNFGSFGTWLGTPIIRAPEVAIAGFGRVDDQVVAVDGRPVVRPTLPVVVSTDHRINDGAHLARFVNDLAAVIEQPLLLLEPGPDRDTDH